MGKENRLCCNATTKVHELATICVLSLWQLARLALPRRRGGLKKSPNKRLFCDLLIYILLVLHKRGYPVSRKGVKGKVVLFKTYVYVDRILIVPVESAEPAPRRPPRAILQLSVRHRLEEDR